MIVFIIKHWRVFLSLGVVVLLGLTYYGGRFTGYQAGQKQAERKCQDEKLKEVEKAIQEAMKSSQKLERNMQNAKRKTNAATDDSLRKLGIMRDVEDR